MFLNNIEITRSTFPCSDIASFSNQVLIECVDDAYNEEMPADTVGGINQGILIPPFVTLRGRGDTRLYIPDIDTTAPVLEAPFSIRLEGLVLENRSRGYALHIDNANGLSVRDKDGSGVLRFPLVTVMKDCTFAGSIEQETWLIGIGISNGHLMVMDNCTNTTVKAAAMFGAHNSPNTTDAGQVEIRNSTFNDAEFTGATGVQLLTSFEQAVTHEVVISNSTLGTVTNGSLIGGELAFRVTRT